MKKPIIVMLQVQIAVSWGKGSMYKSCLKMHLLNIKMWKCFSFFFLTISFYSWFVLTFYSYLKFFCNKIMHINTLLIIALFSQSHLSYTWHFNKFYNKFIYYTFLYLNIYSSHLVQIKMALVFSYWKEIGISLHRIILFF